MDNAPITDNPEKKRFELAVNDQQAILEYVRQDPHTVALTHTEVPPQLEGQGVGSRLVKGVLEHLDANGQMMVPLCGFVQAYLKRHPEWNRLVSVSYDIDEF